MKAIPCVFALIACLVAPSYAQTEDRPQAAYVEIGGSTMFYSLNAEMPVATTRAVRIGAMLLPGISGVTTAFNQFIVRGESRVILGMGLTLVGGSDSHLAAGTATVGYRHTRADGSFFQFAATPFITKGGVHRYAGISFGKSY